MNTKVNEIEVREALLRVNDPELGCNVVDLGLIYSIRITGGHVAVTMTLTTPGCPMHESLVQGVEMALGAVAGVESAAVEVVWDPPWHPTMMTPYGRARVGVV
jgi:metal-sulfur cluster biosynthetic enzyme